MLQETLFDISLETPAENLFKKFSEIQNFIYANEGLSSQQALDEFLKILFIKVFDDKNNDKEFFVSEDEIIKIRLEQKSISFIRRITNLFNKTIVKFNNIFEKDDKIKLNQTTLSYIVSKLQYINFSDTNDAKGLAFQKFLANQEKSDRGQFFTPEPIIDFCVKFINPKPNEKIIDPACGSGGFLFSSYKYLTENYKSDKISIINNLFGLDINKTIVRIAKMKLLLESNIDLNIYNLNSLNNLDEISMSCNYNLENNFDIVLANPPFGTSGKIDNHKILKNFELGYKWKEENGKYYKTNNIYNGQVPEILFIERCFNLLKNGGRMAIILPNGHFENPSLEYLRYFIKQKFRVLSVINLPAETFIPFGTGVKTSILILQKENSYLGNNENIFFSKITKVGYQGNKNGNTIYKKDSFGNNIKSKNLKSIIDEDFTQVLEDYNNFNKNGIISTNLSFSFPFKELNGRFDYDYYNPENRNLITKLKDLKSVKLSEVCEIVKIKSQRLNKLDEYVEYIELSDINTNSFEIINSTNYIVHELPSRASYEIKENDIITSVAGNSIGTNKHATALVTKEYDKSICTNGFRILRNCKIDMYYLLHYLKSDLFLKQIFMYRTGATIPNISDSDLSRILIYLPNENEIKNISEKVLESFQLRKKAKECLEKIKIKI